MCIFKFAFLLGSGLPAAAAEMLPWARYLAVKTQSPVFVLTCQKVVNLATGVGAARTCKRVMTLQTGNGAVHGHRCRTDMQDRGGRYEPGDGAADAGLGLE